MQFTQIKSAKNNNLILFFGGFASEVSHFAHLKVKDKNVIMLYDYRHLEDLSAIIHQIKARYDNICVLAFSLGVSVAHYVNIPCYKAIAINGTGLGISKDYGIAPAIYRKTIQGFNGKNFAHSMLNLTESTQSPLSLRTDDILRQELISLQEWIMSNALQTSDKQHTHWDKAIISQNDCIFPPKALKSYWETYFTQNLSFNLNHHIVYYDLPHFIFHTFNTWEALCLL